MMTIIARQSLRVGARNRTDRSYRIYRINRALIVSRGDRLMYGGPNAKTGVVVIRVFRPIPPTVRKKLRNAPFTRFP